MKKYCLKCKKNIQKVKKKKRYQRQMKQDQYFYKNLQCAILKNKDLSKKKKQNCY